MNRLILCTLILFPLVLSSCGKKIEGTVLDNFGKPIEGAKIQVFNSKFEAETNSAGKYAIDYAAGEVLLWFKHENYISKEEALYITEKQTYPIKDIRLTKIPNEAGIYIASDELSDYTKLISQTTVTSKLASEDNKRFRAARPLEFFNHKTDSITVINLSSLDNVRIYTYKMKKHLFGKVRENRKIAELGTAMYHRYPMVNAPIKLKEYFSNKDLKLYFITPKYGVDYVFILEEGFSNVNNLNTKHYIFRFEK